MSTTAKVTKRIGWGLVGCAVAVWVLGSFLLGPDSDKDFRLITCAMFFYIPGILLAVLGHLLQQLDQRIRLLEQKVDSMNRQGESPPDSPKP